MSVKVILPGATIGILGSGQLGRMMAIAARQLGYRIHCYSPESDSPAGQLCDKEWVGEYENKALLTEFSSSCAVVTYEFENVPMIAATTAANNSRLHPSASVLSICQDRIQEKGFLKRIGVPVPRFVSIESEADIQALPEDFIFPAVLKTSRMGYDGKGQAKINSAIDVLNSFRSFKSVECILESFVEFSMECSVIVARNENGEIACYPVFENIHKNHILDITLAPARVSQKVHQQAIDIARTIAEKLNLVGILAVEMFVLPDQSVMVNELAPRPHNSGHLTIEATHCSQFQQVIRAICNLPLGDPSLIQPAGMLNLLGDRWAEGEPDWVAVLENPNLNLHLYGKQSPRPGRKMGHLTLCGQTPDTIEQQLRNISDTLSNSRS